MRQKNIIRYLKPKNFSEEKLKAVIENMFKLMSEGNSVQVACHKNGMCWQNLETRRFLKDHPDFFPRYVVYVFQSKGPTTGVISESLQRHGREWLDQRVIEARGA